MSALVIALENKLLHGPTQRLRAEAGEGPLAEAAAQLFDLQDAVEHPGHGAGHAEGDPASQRGSSS